MASNFILIFNRELVVDGKVYPSGSIVPAGVIRPALLASLRDSNRIVEVREEELVGKDIPKPHRVPQLSRQLLFAAEQLVEQRTKDLEAATAHLQWLRDMDDEDNAPIDESEPESRGTTRDFEDVGLVVEPVVEPIVEPVNEPVVEAPIQAATPAKGKAAKNELPPQLG